MSNTRATPPASASGSASGFGPRPGSSSVSGSSTRLGSSPQAPRSETTSTFISFPDPTSIFVPPAPPSATCSNVMASPPLVSHTASAVGSYGHGPPPSYNTTGQMGGSPVAGPSGSSSATTTGTGGAGGRGHANAGPHGHFLHPHPHARAHSRSHSHSHSHSRNTSTTSNTLGNHNAPMHSALPSPASTRAVSDARTAFVASMGNLLDNELQTRAASLHQGEKIIAKQEKDVQKGREALRKENDKLMKLVKEGGDVVKMTGNVQHFAETLEREFLILEETLRLARGGGEEDSEASWSASASENDEAFDGFDAREDDGETRSTDADHAIKGTPLSAAERRAARREEERREWEREEQERVRRETEGTLEERMRAMELDQIPRDRKIAVKIEGEGAGSSSSVLVMDTTVTEEDEDEDEDEEDEGKGEGIGTAVDHVDANAVAVDDVRDGAAPRGQTAEPDECERGPSTVPAGPALVHGHAEVPMRHRASAPPEPAHAPAPPP